MIAAAQVAIQPEDQHRLDPGIVGSGHLGDVASQLARGRITFAAQAADDAEVSLAGTGGHALGENSHQRRVLLRASVASDDVVVQRGLDIPSFGLCHLSKMFAAVEPLLFAGHGEKYDSAGEFQLAEDAGALQADGGAAAIVVGAGRGAVDIESVRVARVVVARDQDNPLRGFRIGSFQHRIDIGQYGGIGDARPGRFSKCVGFHLKAAAAIPRVALELALDPFARGPDALARGDRLRILR